MTWWHPPAGIHAAIGRRGPFLPHGEQAVFPPYFARGNDIEDPAVIAGCAREVGIDPFDLDDEMTSGEADDELRHAELQARAQHLTGTPRWLVNDQLIVGLRPRASFFALSCILGSGSGWTDDASTGVPHR